jgi:hypothetical protein
MGVKHPHDPTDLLDNLHGFKQYLNFEMTGGWMPDETAPKIRHQVPELSSNIDNVKDAKRTGCQEWKRTCRYLFGQAKAYSKCCASKVFPSAIVRLSLSRAFFMPAMKWE